MIIFRSMCTCYLLICILGLGLGIQGNFSVVTDLSHSLDNHTIHWPTGTQFQLIIKHRGLINPEFKENETNYWYESNDFITTEHGGTHLDAPVHFGQNQWSVDQIPSDRFVGPVSVVDLRERVKNNSEYQITAEDLKEWESDQRSHLNSLIILWTGWAKHWSNREKYLGTVTDNTSQLHFPGLHPHAAEWLVNSRSVHGIAIDTASIDYGQTKLFESHRILSKKNIFVIENLNTNNLNGVECKSLFLIVTPLKITTGSGSPVRPLIIEYPSNISNKVIIMQAQLSLITVLGVILGKML